MHCTYAKKGRPGPSPGFDLGFCVTYTLMRCYHVPLIRGRTSHPHRHYRVSVLVACACRNEELVQIRIIVSLLTDISMTIYLDHEV